MPIKAVLQSIYSRRDKFGNVYWAFRFTDTATGKSVEGTISGGESNIRSMLRPLGLESSEVHSSIIELPIRQWNALTKDFRYAGCTADQLAAFVRAELERQA